MVDVLGFLTLGNIFTAHITGNLVVVAASLARGGPWSPAQILTIPVFVAALSIVWVFARMSRTRGAQLALQLPIPHAVSTAVMTGNLTNVALSLIDELPKGTAPARRLLFGLRRRCRRDPSARRLGMVHARSSRRRRDDVRRDRHSQHIVHLE
jgi:uncharacterized membrane protein YoaK (UPF0700 family)